MRNRPDTSRSDERRTAERHDCLGAAQALQLSPRKEYRCIVKDVSESGCRLVGVDLDHVRSPFLLRMSQWSRPRECDVRWRARKTIGVAFTDTAPDRL